MRGYRAGCDGGFHHLKYAVLTADLGTKESRAASCGRAASAVLLVAISRSSDGAEVAARASVARQP